MSVMVDVPIAQGDVDEGFAYCAVYEVTVPNEYYFDQVTLWRVEDYIRGRARVQNDYPVEWWAEYARSTRRCDYGTRKNLSGVKRYFARLTIQHG